MLASQPLWPHRDKASTLERRNAIFTAWILVLAESWLTLRQRPNQDGASFLLASRSLSFLAPKASRVWICHWTKYAGPRKHPKTGRPPGRTFGVALCWPVMAANSLHFGPAMALENGRISFRRRFAGLACRMMFSM